MYKVLMKITVIMSITHVLCDYIIDYETIHIFSTVICVE